MYGDNILHECMDNLPGTRFIVLEGAQHKPVRPPLKKSLSPVQRVAIIVASREAAKSFFFFFFFPLYRNGRKNAGGKKKNREI